jgi:rubrerythrin
VLQLQHAARENLEKSRLTTDIQSLDRSKTLPSKPIKIGSEDHKRLFCRALLDTFDPYKPALIAWPQLAPDALARLTGLPFWGIAVQTEERATVHIANMAKETSDPLVREALELIAFEENRHRRVLEGLVAHYGIKHEEPEPYTPSARTEWNFMSTGYGECVDSFFAFGLFEVARRSGYFPPELVETFEPVIQEEARHIVFFVNWAAHMQANTALAARPFFALKRLLLLAENGFARLGLAKGDQEDFANNGKDSVGVDIGLREFMDICLAENERRMGNLDGRLLRPKIMPRLAKTLRLFVR